MSDDGGQAAARYLGRAVGGGRFQLRSLLGAGGMASVYLAYDSVLERQVAVKTLHTELGREQSFRERFRREAQAVAKLGHTNVVSVFDSGEDEIDGATVPYIVMEYVEGEPLRAVLDQDVARHGAMPTERALHITADVLAALEASHERGLVHRDIKPGNVMVSRRGVVKVMDFGIARAVQSGVTSMTQTGMVVGTPQYLSPEQALGRGVDARADLYSVGIMLFELLTGRLPFDADSPLAIAYAHVQQEPPQPSSVNQAVPPAVDALVARALRKNPDERFPSAAAMREECRRVGGSGAASGAAPIIVGGGPPAHGGSGVGQAVFPPVGAATPPPVGAPATPPPPHGGAGQPYPQPYPHPYGGYGPATPPPTGTPVPYGAPYGPPQGAPPTPPPYGGPPGPLGGPSGRRRNRTPAVVGSAMAAVVVAAVVLVLTLSGGGGDDGDRTAAGPSPTAPEAGGTAPAADPAAPGAGSATGAPAESGAPGSHYSIGGTRPEDTSLTIDPSRCTHATPSYRDENKVLLPDFVFKNLTSVKECLRRAGWKLGDVRYADENLWGRNTVLKQSPESVSEFDGRTQRIDLTVSTGKPPQ